ncbi:MAG: STAS domain-containing protein [Candidatus Zixiibacteriota bacterium]
MSINEITIEKVDRYLIVITTGRVLDNNNAHEMVQVITSAQEQGYKFIVIDMTSLEFISSAGVGSFLGTVETSREAGGDIILCHAREEIMHVFQVLDLIDYLTIKNSLDEAKTLCVQEK